MKIGFGTYKTNPPAEAVRSALEAGYRYIDTASIYNTEKAVREAIELTGINREEIHIATKCWLDETGYEGTKAALGRSLKRLGTDYVDTYLIHWPRRRGDDNWKETLRGTWKAMNELKRDGYIRRIGASNFLPHHLDVIDGIPDINQLELHPGYMQEAALKYSQELGIQVQAWSPLGREKSFALDYINELAGKYSKSPAQICIRYLLDRDIMPIVKSSTPERIRENLDVFDFNLTKEEISYITCLPQTTWRGEHPDINIPTKTSNFEV